MYTLHIYLNVDSLSYILFKIYSSYFINKLQIIEYVHVFFLYMYCLLIGSKLYKSHTEIAGKQYEEKIFPVYMYNKTL